MFKPKLLQLFTLGFSISLCHSKELVFSHVLFRHGDRTPYPGDTFGPPATNYWPQGHGELTVLGMRQAFELGTYLRTDRYKDYLSDYYSNYEIYIRSDDYNRTLMTAGAVMNGLFYPPLDNQTFHNGTPWFPVPIHTVGNLAGDYLLNMGAKCPVCEKMQAAEFATPAAMKYITDNQQFIDFLENKTSHKIDTLDGLWAISDGFYSQQQNYKTHPLPSWANKTVFDKAIHLYEISLRYLYGTKAIQRLRGGSLLEEITYRMITLTKGNLTKPTKLYGYSAHDTTILALLKNMGAFNDLNPPFASAVIVELYKDDNEFLVELHYRNETDKDPYMLDIGGCAYPCKLDAFKSRSMSYFPGNWMSECGFTSNSEASSENAYKVAAIVLACTTGICLFVCFILIVLLRSSKRSKVSQIT